MKDVIVVDMPECIRAPSFNDIDPARIPYIIGAFDWNHILGTDEVRQTVYQESMFSNDNVFNQFHSIVINPDNCI